MPMVSSDVDTLEDIERPGKLVPIPRLAGRLAHLEIADARPPHLTSGRQQFDHGADFEVLQPLRHTRVEPEPERHA